MTTTPHHDSTRSPISGPPGAPTRIAVDDAPINSFHWRLVTYTAGGPFLDGYVLSILGVAMIQLSPQMGLTSMQEGLIGATALVGIFLGASITGHFSDRYGRKRLYTLDLLAIALLSVAQFFAAEVISLIILRLLVGIALGADYPLASSLLTEFTPKKWRGPFLGALIAVFFLGASVAYLVGELLLSVGDDAWRWMLASSALPALIFVVLRRGTPESPRWLAAHGRLDEAQSVVTRIYGPDVYIPAPAMGNNDPSRRIGGIFELFRSGYTSQLVFVTTFFNCAVIPIFAISVFGPQILSALNLEGSEATLGSAALQAIFLIGCVGALLLVNRLGRRPMILHSFFWSGAALLLLAAFPDAAPGWVALLFAMFAIAAGGTQILTWIYPNEIFPTEIRGVGVGLSSSLSRIGAAVGTFLVPLALQHLGTSPTMYIATGIAAIGFTASLIWAPETRGKPLDDVIAH